MSLFFYVQSSVNTHIKILYIWRTLWWFRIPRNWNLKRLNILTQFQLLQLATHWRCALTAVGKMTWWRHQMETSSALLAICAGISPGTSEFRTQRPVKRSFDVFFDLKQRLSKQPWAGDLRRHRAHYDVTVMELMWPWRRDDMETFSALLVLRVGIHRSVIGGFPIQRARDDISFVVCLNNLLNKQMSCRWFVTL